MMSPDFWTDKNDEKTLLSSGQINDINNKNSSLLFAKCIGSFSLDNITDEFSGEAVKEMISSYELPEELEKLYVNNSRVGSEYWENLIDNLNLDSVPEKVSVKFGFSVRRASLRMLTTDDYMNEDKDDLYYDGLIASDFMPFCPLAVLHESKDGEWYYVAMRTACGWVKKEDTALCSNRDEWMLRRNPTDFLVVTGSELVLPDDPYCKAVSGLRLPMGTVLPLVKSESSPDEIRSRSTYGSYVVKLPTRDANGRIKDEFALIPLASDVNTGYLPYCHKSVVSLAFKLLGNVYGWAGSLHSNDCSGIIRQIFLCFGFEMPRLGYQQAKAAGFKNINIEQLKENEKLKTVLEAPAGSLVYFSGHIMIYLGEDKGEPFVLSSVGSISQSDLKAGETMDVNSVVVTSLMRTARKTGVSWLNSLTDILICEPENK